VGSHRVGERVTLRLVDVGRNLTGKIVDATTSSSPTPTYRGYQVRRGVSLGKVLKDPWDLKVGTSRYGSTVQEILPSISNALKAAQSVVVAFGAPNVGLKEILAFEKLVPSEVFNYFVNTLPDQQTATVRAEEALLVSLGIMNLATKLDLGETVANRVGNSP
jgi:predicted SPOUT superfamily RNA methylase MTH1